MQNLHDGAVEPRMPTTTEQERSAPNTRAAYFSLRQMRQYGQAKNRGKFVRCRIGADQIFSMVVMVETSGSLVKPTPPWWPGAAQEYSLDVAIFHQRAEQWRQQLLAVAGHRGNSASGDKVGGIFQNPGEFIDKLQQVAIHCGEGFFRIAQQEAGTFCWRS